MKWNDYRRKAIKYATNMAIADLVAPGVSPREDYKPTWTIKDEDHDGLYSLKKWFLKYRSDPTETEFVDNCFEGDFRHWEAFKNSQFIKPIYERIKKEATQRNLADVMQKIMNTAMDDNNKSQMVALKYLVDKYSKEAGEELTKRGRPKKSEVERAAREIAEDEKATLEDLKRITA